MKSATFTPPWSDEAIVAWLDGEMNDADAQRFKAQMAEDAALAGRVAELSVNTDAIRQRSRRCWMTRRSHACSNVWRR